MRYNKIKLEQLLTTLTETKSIEDNFLDQLRKYHLDEFIFENEYAITYNKQIELLLTYAFSKKSYEEVIQFLYDIKPIKWYIKGIEYEINTVSDFMLLIEKCEIEIEFNKELDLETIKVEIKNLTDERNIIIDEINVISPLVANCIMNNTYIKSLNDQISALMDYCFGTQYSS